MVGTGGGTGIRKTELSGVVFMGQISTLYKKVAAPK